MILENQRINFLEDEVMKQNIQEAMEIMTASPLLDDLSKYNMIGGIQQQFINPEVQFAMGASDNQSISYLLNNRSILPQDIKILAESSIMPFGPKAYLDPSRYAGDQHPGIHGIKSYQYASNGAAMAWLGDSRKQNLVYDDTGKNYNNDLPTLTGEGRQAVKSKWQSKVNCEG